MGSIIRGKDVILLYRDYEKRETEPAKLLAFQTEHSFNMSRSSDSNMTKDGAVRSVGEIEYDFTSTAQYERGSETIKMLYDSFMNKKKIEIWVMDRMEENPDKPKTFFSHYVQATVINFEPTATAEDNVELSLTYAVELVHQDGYATLTEEQQQQAQYVFADTTPMKKETE